MNRPLASLGGRYTITREIASGGMATVYLGRLAGPGGFSRLVAIKRPHPHVARHPEFCAMLLDEGRLAASISHPNVVSTLDVVAEGDDLFLVMEYVPGETLAQVLRAARRRDARMPPSVACGILRGVLLGLAAVHEARDEHGEPLAIVHRDISPQNILVGQDGVARILDFGVAKAAGRLQVTREGQLKGKIAYMAPEQMRGHVTNRTDICAASIVLWEALAGQRLFAGNDEVEVFSKVLAARIDPPSNHALAAEDVSPLRKSAWDGLDAIVLQGLARDPADRFASAKDMADALERCLALATPAEIRAWIQDATAHRPFSSSEHDVVGAEKSSVVTARDASGPITLTKSGQDALAVHVREEGDVASGASAASAPSSGEASDPSPAAVHRRLRGARVAALGLAAVALLATGAFLALARAPTPTSAPAASLVLVAPPAASSVESSVAMDVLPPEPPAAPAPGASTGGGHLDEAPSAARARTKAARKNRTEGARVPVASQSIDVSHAIDQRH